MCLKQNSVWKVIFFWAVNSYSITMIHNYIIRVEMYYKTELRLEFLAWKFEPVFWQKHCIILDCKKRWKTFKAAILSIWFLMYRFPTSLMCVLTCKEITLLTKNHSYWFLANLIFPNNWKLNKNSQKLNWKRRFQILFWFHHTKLFTVVLMKLLTFHNKSLKMAFEFNNLTTDAKARLSNSVSCCSRFFGRLSSENPLFIFNCNTVVWESI